MRGTLLQRKPAILPVVMGGKVSYSAKVLGMDPANLIGYWRCNETSGTTATDLSGNSNHGTYSGVTLGQAGADGSGSSIFLDGSAGYLNLYAIAGEFVATEFTISAWIKDNASWDAGTRNIIRLRADNSNYIRLYRNTQTIYSELMAGGTSDIAEYTYSVGPTGWINVGLTVSVSGDKNILYIEGVSRQTKTTLGTWAGSLAATTTLAGNLQTTSPLQVWSGWLQDIAIWKSARTPEQMASLAAR